MADTLWKRVEIISCNCSDKHYRHVHCPCFVCKGQAVDRHTEFRHWNNTKIALGAKHANAVTVNSYRFEDEHANLEEDTVDSSPPNDSEGFKEDQNDIEMPDAEETEFSSNEENRENHDENPLRKVIVDAVIEAIKIKNSSGVSIETFTDILEFGKSLLLVRIGEENVDKDILLTLWPKTWNQVQKLLKEEGYSDAELLYICFFSEEKQQTRNGTLSKKIVYCGRYSVMKDKNSLCEFCGKKGWLKYYYLGLKSKVKHWFKSKDMCDKMLAHWKDRKKWLGCNISNKVKSEVWDGDRWLELQWFCKQVDPASYLLIL